MACWLAAHRVTHREDGLWVEAPLVLRGIYGRSTGSLRANHSTQALDVPLNYLPVAWSLALAWLVQSLCAAAGHVSPAPAIDR